MEIRSKRKGGRHMKKGGERKTKEKKKRYGRKK